MTPCVGLVRRSAALVLLIAAVGAGSVIGVPRPAHAAVPVASGNNAVITLKVGGDRFGIAGVTALAGVTLGLFDTAAATAPVAGFGTCVSDADGDCSFTVPATQVGGANRDRRFFVKQIAAPTGYHANRALATGTTVTPDPYVFRTGALLRSGSTYSSTSDFMISADNSDNEASGGFWQNSRNDPPLPAECGLRVALVTDLSASVTDSLADLKAAATSFVNSLVGTPSTVSLFTFASISPANTTNDINRTALNPVSTQAGADVVNGYINGLTIPTSGANTNWGRALAVVAEAAPTYDIAVMLTDGDPTVFSQPARGPGNRTRFREVEAGVFTSNETKAKGTRIVAFGVGRGTSGSANLNLAAISGPNANSDYYQTSNYAQAAATLRGLARGACNGSITVVKKVIPPGGTAVQAQPAGGWQFAATSSGGLTTAPAAGTTASGTGALAFTLTAPDQTPTQGTSTVTETQQAGYTLVTQAGANAVCVRTDTGASLPVTNTGPTGFSVATGNDHAVSCTVLNQAPQPLASAVVDVNWVIDGVSYPDGTQDPRFIARLTLDGTAQDVGLARQNLTSGDSLTIDQTVTVTNSHLLCTVDSRRLTSVQGASVDLPLPATQLLATGANRYTITNTVTCSTQLELDAAVANGPATPAEWTLSSLAPNGALAGPTGTTGITAAVTPNVVYPLAESGGDPRYVQDDRRGTSPVAGSSGSWVCQQIDPVSGAVVPGFQGGLNGSVIALLGYKVRCTATNFTASLTLVKDVVNSYGTTAVPGQWTLTATPSRPVPSGLSAVGVTGSSAGVLSYARPGQTYALGETGPSGYRASAWGCRTDGVTATGANVVLGPGAETTCALTNTTIAPRITLVSTVRGGPAAPTYWTLVGSGPTPLSGVTGTTAVTGAPVSVGTYLLGESAGPPGYTASAWTCSGATVSNDRVTVGPGAAITCFVVNSFVGSAAQLPDTGVRVRAWGALAVLLLFGGGVLLAAGRSRRRPG